MSERWALPGLVTRSYATIGLGAWYEQRPLPVVKLNGTDPASLRYKDVDQYGASLNLIVKLQ